jgi:hypothetical protein
MRFGQIYDSPSDHLIVSVTVFVAGSLSLPRGNLMFTAGMEFFLYLLACYEDWGAEFAGKLLDVIEIRLNL